MSEVYEGDSWKNADDRPRPPEFGRVSRAVVQQLIDRSYAERRMTLVEWRRQTDYLGTVAADLRPLRQSRL